jgi:TAG lipase/steryl ester hydrolase/phospholipase A2/LPA acyltransferase
VDHDVRAVHEAMHRAADYKTWSEAASELDKFDGLDEWKDDEASDHYDWRLIRSRLRQIRNFRADKQTLKLVHHLRQGLHWNLGNIGNPSLYRCARIGTKKLIAEYVHEVCDALEELAAGDLPEFPQADKHKFFHDVALSYGRSALMLSGGATLGLFHVGVVRALYREGVLPEVMSGSSAGSIVAATVGSRRADDLEELLDPHNAYYHFWRVLPLRQMVKRGSVMDQTQLRRAIAKNIRDLTFEEAYKLSGRAINITVSPAGSNQQPKLLNYLTFPYLYLREAVLASCAVPVLFPPVMLMSSDETGNRTPYMPLLRWNDGSLKSDLPMLRLRRLHNVNHFIVSQTNPHVLPFVSEREPGTVGLRNSARDYAYSTMRSQTTSVLNFARANLPIKRLHRSLDAATSILDQDYRGNINIYPEASLWRYIQVTSNPTLDNVRRFLLEGERAAWGRVEMIRTQTAISMTLERCLEAVETAGASNTRRKLQGVALKVVRDRSGGVAVPRR